jgi:hypothetical protein
MRDACFAALALALACTVLSPRDASAQVTVIIGIESEAHQPPAPPSGPPPSIALPATGRLELIEPAQRARTDDGEDVVLSLALGSLSLITAGATGLAATLASMPHEPGAPMPDWAPWTIGLSTGVAMIGVMGLGSTFGAIAGADPSATLLTAGGTQLALALLLSMVLIGVAPDVVGPWGDPFAQQVLVDVLAGQAISLAAGGLLSMMLSIASGEPATPSPTANVRF